MITHLPFTRVLELSNRIEKTTGQQRDYSRLSRRYFYAAGMGWQLVAIRDKQTDLWRVSIDI